LSFRLRFGQEPRVEEEFDVIVVGAGPAGLTAAIYSARFALKTLIVSENVGGQLIDAGMVDDYPGLPDTPGSELAKKFEEHVSNYGVPIVNDTVIDVRKTNELFEVVTRKGKIYKGKAVILAVGSTRRKLNVPGEKELTGRGVSYCAPCDAPLFKGKVSAVVGGGNAALQAALLLTSYCPKVYLIHRREQFRAFPIYVKLVKQNPKVELVLNSVVTEIGGHDHVEWVKIKNVKTGEERKLEIGGIVIEIGLEPAKDFFQTIGLETDEKGYIKVKPGMLTNIEGLFAAGDCTAGPCKKKFDQIVTAAGEGAIAALSAYEYIIKKWGLIGQIPEWGGGESYK
jgi:thioredoxin reductase (NADPH)